MVLNTAISTLVSVNIPVEAFDGGSFAASVYQELIFTPEIYIMSHLSGSTMSSSIA